MPAPTREGRGLDAFNDQLRANPEYRAFLQSIGVNPDAAIRLSGRQRSQVEDFVRQQHPDLAGKFQIDPAGNINTDHGVSTAWSNPAFRYPLLAAGAIGTAGALGAFGGLGAVGGTGATSSAGLFPGAFQGSLSAGSLLGTAPGAAGAAGGGGMGFFGSLGRFFGGNAGGRLIDAAGNLIGNQIQSGANDRATEIQDRYLRDALAYQQEQDRLAREQYEREYTRRIGIEDGDRTRRIGFEDARERRLAPYRDIAQHANGYRTLAGLLDPNQQQVVPRRGVTPTASPARVVGDPRQSMRLADLI